MKKPSPFLPCIWVAASLTYLESSVVRRVVPERQELADLLRRAVAQPFFILAPEDGVEPSLPDSLVRWARQLQLLYPLWALQPRSYAALNKTDLPTTYPLAKVVRSIASDDEALGSTGAVIQGLPALLDARRCRLCRGDGDFWGSDHVEQVGDGRYEVSYIQFGFHFPRILDGPVLAFHEPDTEYTIGGYFSPYEEIGMELVSLVEAREAETGTRERADAQDSLDEFLRRLAVTVRGRPTSLRDHTARALFHEGSSFVGLCWEVVATPIALHRSTKQILAALALVESEAELSALRLALPNLSKPELLLLRDRARGTDRDAAAVDNLTVHLIAHRLQLAVPTVSRKVLNGWRAEALELSGTTCIVCGDVHRG